MNMIVKGVTQNVRDDYARRMIEQGRATPAPPPPPMSVIAPVAETPKAETPKGKHRRKWSNEL